MTDTQLEQLIRAWYWRDLPEDAGPGVEAASKCAPFSALWRSITNGYPLNEYASHVLACDRCQRLSRVMQREHDQAAPVVPHPILAVRGRILTTRRLTALVHSRLVQGGLAAAVLLVVLLTMFIHTEQPVRAEDLIQTINRKFIFDGPFPDLDVLNDPEELKQRWAVVLAAAQTLGESKEVAAREAEREEDGYYPAGGAMHAWTHVYRGLRDLGQWDLAIQEMHKALEYTQNTVSPSRTLMPDWHTVVLHDLGQTYAMMGDFNSAREWYERSILARKANYGRPGDPEAPDPGKETGYMTSLVALYWRLADMALIENDLDEARAALSEAERLLREYFTAFATAVGVLPRGTGILPVEHGLEAHARDYYHALLEAYRALPPEFRQPQESTPDNERQVALERYGIPKPEATQVGQIREHLLRVARVRRAEGDLAAAKAVLDDAATIPFYPMHDESRLDFSEPFERARIAIAEQDFTAALAHLEDAAKHTGPVVFGGDKNADFPAIGPQLRAQLQVLRGLAILGLDPSKAEGRALVQNSWDAIQMLAKSMNPQEQERFLQQFKAWRRVMQRTRSDD